MTDLIRLHPQEFVGLLNRQGIRRAYLVSDPSGTRMLPSHPALQPLAEFVQGDQRDFAHHEGIFLQVSSEHETLQGAFVHRTARGAAAGGVRYWSYDTVEDYLRDGLRLSQGMTHKNALAGLWWGGGKGVMAHNPNVRKDAPEVRATLYRDYGRFMSSLRGCYVTAEDVGTHVTDMAHVFARTRFTTCIPTELGGSGNPSVPTARGVIAGMQAALEFAGLGDLRGKRVAVQGMGNVGGPVIRFLFEAGVAKVIAADVDAATVDRVVQQYRGMNLEARVVERADISILGEECDIVSPCATGATLNPRTIPAIRARIVCGAANNQLEDPKRDDRALFDKSILYVPDFLTNRMGIVNCADEQFGTVTHDPLIERHLSRDWEHSIHATCMRVFAESRDMRQPPGQVALRMAEALSMEPHPLTGHRGRQIIASLVADRWQDSDL